MLNHPASDGEKQARVWWGFSVVTDLEMDLSGVIGFGVELQHLEQKLPWTNLINVLGFGEIILDRKFKVTAIPEGYQLCLVPRKTPAQVQESRALIPENVFSALPGAVFVLDKAGKLCQQNEAAKTLGRIWKGRAYSEGFSLTFPTQPNRFSKLLRAIEDAKKGLGSDLELKLLKPSRVFEYWSASVRPLPEGAGSSSGILIQVFDVSEVKSQVFKTSRENERLRDLALSPSHILRGPLSSIIGLLDLIDAKQLDEENQNLFGYLKPLTKELDRTIRQHAKKMSTFE
ncbi:hypothetical protein GCM10009119_40470 [Algoriphagus jejuensis]|uniref:PAS domain-containing protein n=1 Tax=Algoriphagus jejuensis TaxID=419934 RepID=A0ABP3YK38_9BACT